MIVHDMQPPCICRLWHKGRKIIVTYMYMYIPIKGVTQNSEYRMRRFACGSVSKLSPIGKQCWTASTCGARYIMSVQFMNGLATNTKRAYDMRDWKVGHGSSSPLFLFLLQQVSVQQPLTVVFKHIASIISTQTIKN